MALSRSRAFFAQAAAQPLPNTPLTALVTRGLTYFARDRLCVNLTDRFPAPHPLWRQRGPHFQPFATSSDTFAALSDAGRAHPQTLPTAKEIFLAAQKILRSDAYPVEKGIVIGGVGDPLLRLDTVLELVVSLKEVHPNLPVRVNTSGLVYEHADFANFLLGFDAWRAKNDPQSLADDEYRLFLQHNSVAVASCEKMVSTLSSAGVDSVNVLFPGDTPERYAAQMGFCVKSAGSEGQASELGLRAFSHACKFMCMAAREEVRFSTVCTAVAAPGVDIPAVEEVCLALGAKELRVKNYEA